MRVFEGITYNENLKELYWTASKSIIAGSSVNPNQYRILFNLDAAKKLLYLKYDNISNSIYVSTLNYVYACSLKQNEQTEPCRIIARDLVSARGLYLDSLNQQLYVVDHKKKKIKKIRLIDQQQQAEDIETSSTLLSADVMPDLGDVFYMCIYGKTNTLIWSEFSGKIKISDLNNLSKFKLLFSTNEYTYSISLMENSSNIVQAFRPSTTTTASLKYSSTRILHTSKAIELVEPTRPVRKISSKSITSILTSRIIKSTTTAYQTTTPLTTTTATTTTTTTTPITTTTPTTTTTTTTLTFKIEPTSTVISTSTTVSTEEPLVDQSLVFKTLESDKTSEDDLKANKEIQRGISTKSINDDSFASESLTENLNVNLKKQEASYLKEIKNEMENKTLSLINEKTDSTKISYLRSSYLNVSLYVVISLLCLSLVINIVLLYVSKIRYSKSVCSNKLMLSNDICNSSTNKTATIPSQHSGSGSSSSKSSSKCVDDDEIADCNINLIKSNDYLGNNLDSDH